MAAFPEAPDDFVAWLATRGESFGPHDFAPRSLYGAYLEARLAAAARGGTIEVAHGEGIDVEPASTRARVTLAGGRSFTAAGVVFALGNTPPRPLPELALVADRRQHIADPLGDGARLEPRRDDTVALIGTGLTALDVVSWLRTRGHRGRVVLISRHGLLPRPHAPPAASLRLTATLGKHPSITRLLSELRACGAAGVDELRPMTAAIWRRLDHHERRQFLRHARPFWEVHRHRAPPATHSLVENGRADGWLEVRAARIAGASPSGMGRLRLELRPRGGSGATGTLETDWIVNCTGPERDVTRQPGRLVAALRRRGLVAPDALGLGVHTGPAGELLDAHGRIVPRLYTVGAWRVADLWESTAVPELRQQTADVADRLSIEADTFPAPVHTRCSP